MGIAFNHPEGGGKKGRPGRWPPGAEAPKLASLVCRHVDRHLKGSPHGDLQFW